jgi:hypothetical protein
VLADTFARQVPPEADFTSALYAIDLDRRRERWEKEYRFDHLVDRAEMHPGLAQGLQEGGIYNRVLTKDFLQLSPESTGLYDLVVMNPPFDRERDIDHVIHALKVLKVNGRLVAIMSAGTAFRETKKSSTFRALMRQMKAHREDLPPGSFSESRTNVNTPRLTLSL